MQIPIAVWMKLERSENLVENKWKKEIFQMTILIINPDGRAWQQKRQQEASIWESEPRPNPYDISGMRRLTSDFNQGQLRKLTTPDLELFRYLTDPSKW
jgi:hypothetical protein